MGCGDSRRQITLQDGPKRHQMANECRGTRKAMESLRIAKDIKIKKETKKMYFLRSNILSVIKLKAKDLHATLWLIHGY